MHVCKVLTLQPGHYSRYIKQSSTAARFGGPAKCGENLDVESGGAAEVLDMQRMHESMMRVIMNRTYGASVMQGILKGSSLVSRGPGWRVGAAGELHACTHEKVRSGCTRRIRAWQSLSNVLPVKRMAASNAVTPGIASTFSRLH